MKSKIVSFILVCFVGITSQAAVEYSVLRINNDNVKLAQKNLKVELRYNKWRQIAAVSGFAGLLGFSAYKFLLSDAPAAAVPHPNVGSLTDADIHNFRWLLGELVNKFNVAKPALTWPSSKQNEETGNADLYSVSFNFIKFARALGMPWWNEHPIKLALYSIGISTVTAGALGYWLGMRRSGN
jgi:hypothetical protein